MSSIKKLDKSRLVNCNGGRGCDNPRDSWSAPLSFPKCCGASPSSPSVRNLDGSEAPVYVHSCARQIAQPRVFRQEKLAGDDFVIRAEWEIKEFVWLSDFLDGLPREYLLLLDLLDVDPDDYSLELLGFYRYHHKRDKNRKCDVEHIFVPIVKCGKYHPYASIKHRRRASSQALDRLEFLEEECRKRRVKFDYLVDIELTLPKQISGLWSSDKVRRCIREAVKDFLSVLHEKLFKGRSSQFGVIANHHYWSTKAPLSPHRHVHLTMPNVCYNKKTGMFHRFQPYVDADLVREVWRDALRRSALWGEIPDSVEPDVFVHYVKFEERNRVLHRLSYCCRKPVEDLVQNLSEDDLDDFDVDFAMFLLDYTPRRVNLGFLTNLKRFGYNRKSIPLKCPVCGGDMYPERDKFGHPVLYDRPPPNMIALFKSRSGEWRRASSLNDLIGGEINA